MKLPAIRLSRLWPFLVWCAVGVILFWPVRGYYVALPAPDSAPFFPAAHRLRYIEQFLAGNTALSPHHLFSLLLPPLVHHDLIYLIDTLLIASGVAYLLRGRGMPSTAAWIGGGILAFAGYSFTLVSAGHAGFFHMTVYATFMFGFLVRALRGDGWPYFALTGLFGAWVILFGPDFGFVFLLLAAAYGLWLLLRNAGRQPWNARLRPLAVGVPIAALCFMLGAWSTLRIIFTEHLQKREQQIAATAPRPAVTDAAPSADGAGDPQAKWIFATNWSLHPGEIVEFVAPCLFGTQSGDPQAPYWGKLGRTLGWEQHRQGFPNYRQHAIYLGGLQLLLAAFAVGYWVKTRGQGDGRRETGDGGQGAGGSRQSAVPAGSAGPAVGSVDLSPAQANLEIRKAGRGAISSKNSCFPAFQIQEEQRGAKEPAGPASSAPSDPWLPDIPFWACVWVIGLLLAFGRHAPVYRLFYSLPYMSLLRAPVKFIRLVELATAILAASGLACLMQPGARRWRGWTIGAGVCAGLALLGAIWAGGADAAIRQTLEPMRLAPAAALLKGNLVRALLHGAFACGVAAALFFLRGRLRNSVLPILVLAAAWLALDALLVNRRFIMGWDLSPIYRDNVVTRRVLDTMPHGAAFANHGTPSTVQYWFSGSLYYAGIRRVEALPEGQLREMLALANNDLVRVWEIGGAGYALIPSAWSRRMARDRCEHVAWLQIGDGVIHQAPPSENGAELLRIKNPWPYAYLSGSWRLVKDEATARAALFKNAAEGRPEAVFVGDSLPAAPESGRVGRVTIKSSRFRNGALSTRLEIAADTPQMLTVRETAQPPLAVFLDGERQTIVSNSVGVGIYVPPGNHQVVLRTEWKPCGLALASAPCLVMFLVGVVCIGRARSNKTGVGVSQAEEAS